MILTLTANPALDRIIFIDEFKPGTVMRPQRMLDRVGGKGLCASVALRPLGVETVAIAFVAGQIGQRLVEILQGYGVRLDLIWLAGESRLSHVLAEQKRQRHSHIIVGNLPLTAGAVTDFLQRFQAQLPQASGVVAAGSLPPGAPPDLYRSLIEISQAAGKAILIDGTGGPIQAMRPARPDILKLNWAEFNHTFACSSRTMTELQRQARIVYEREQFPALVVTCGEHGLLALTPEGNYRVTVPKQRVVNAAGAGDAASGLLAWRRAEADSFAEALRWATAVGAAVVLSEGTADYERADLERLLSQTKVARW
jgi:1-phosphofructokinase family hexose kinase